MKLDASLISNILQALAAIVGSLAKVKQPISPDAQFQIEQAIASHTQNLSDSINQIIASEVKQQQTAAK